MFFLKQIVFPVIIVSIVFMSCDNTQKTIHVEGETFLGVIFTSNFSYTYPDGETLVALDYVTGEPKGIWTPSYNDILQLEQKLDIINKDSLRFKNLDSYSRQYIGFIDEIGGRNIWINLLALKDIEEVIDRLPIITHDTDSSVFTINYNLQDSSFFDLRFY